ncbi:MAG TPA: polysaccharide deacetylase family protein [Telluria sp.]
MTGPRAPSGLSARLIRAIGNGIAALRGGSTSVCIISYHRIVTTSDPLLDSEPNAETFRWQMQLLAECFNVLPLHAALAALDSGDMPPRAVCITFDDGYRSVHDLALPILREFALPATVFVTTGYIGSGNMWNEKIIEAVRSLPDGPLDLRAAGLGTRTLHSVDDRQRLLVELTERAKYLPPVERQTLTDQLIAVAGGGSSEGLMLTPAMIRALAADGIEIGAHTVTHPILSRIDDDQARHEIAQCRRDLEAITGSPVRYFAYPNGKPGIDFDQRHAALAREAGYEAAFSTVVRAAGPGDDRYQLPRSRPWDSSPTLYALRLLRWLAYRGAPTT